MRKIITMFVLVIAFSMVFAGAVSAQDVETVVLDENGDPVDVANPGDEVIVAVATENTGDENISDPTVEVSVDPDSGLVLDPSGAVMTWTYTDGDTDTYTNDPNDPFFYWNDVSGTWEWWVGWAVSDNLMYPNESATLVVPAIVTDLGEITVNADFLGYDVQTEDYVLLDSDSYTFLSVLPSPEPVNAETVPMQDTGAPLAALTLGMLSIVGGAVYGKLR